MTHPVSQTSDFSDCDYITTAWWYWRRLMAVQQLNNIVLLCGAECVSEAAASLIGPGQFCPAGSAGYPGSQDDIYVSPSFITNSLIFASDSYHKWKYHHISKYTRNEKMWNMHFLIVIWIPCLCTCRLEIVFTGKTIGIVAKSSKTLGDSVSSVLQKHQLQPQDAVITVVCIVKVKILPYLRLTCFDSVTLAVAVRFFFSDCIVISWVA